ncbi:DDE-type integrase/transposase/recombinase [Oleiagrimonas citrea]|uniref:Transposase n=1 Tax=Oleiagrimonas citrea TaxID=1665687 RepID=A0A846ZG86_9GAMM|nr:Mu transposase C-terminal domain-containing protein [Oleiagrimonas citrea]NKZ37342.1 transposase [Oleiagrimonas citrea]
MNKQLIAGSRWLDGDRIVEIDGPLGAKKVQVRDVQTGRLLPAVIETLRPISDKSKLSDPQLVSQDEWDRALALANAFAAYVTGNFPHQVADELAKRFGIGKRQLMRQLEKYRPMRRTSALVRQRAGRPLGLRLLAPEIERIIQHVIRKYYAVREPVSKAEVCERSRLICRKLGLPQPDPKTINTRIKDHDAADLAYKQSGSKAARQRFQARPGKFVADSVLGVVQIDHTLADILLVADDDPTCVIGRPWLTLAIDVATRAVVGYYLSMHAPSAVSVAMCVAHLILPKSENDLEPDLWPMHGLPTCILVDNGKDLRSTAFQRGCEQYGIELKWRPVRTPHYGAHIERLMGTFMRRVHTLPGTTFSNAKQRGDYPSESKACLTLSDFRAWLVEQICHGYHVRRHRGIGMPPLVAWERAFTSEDGNSIQPPAPIDNKALRRDFYPFVYRRMQRTGVHFKRSRYWHPDLALLVHPECQVQVHYHPEDSSRVWVRADDDLLIETPAVAGVALGEGKRVVLDEADKARIDDLKQKGYDRMDTIRDGALHRKRKHQHAIKRESKQEKSQSRKVQQSGATSRPPVPLNRGAIVAEVLDS